MTDNETLKQQDSVQLDLFDEPEYVGQHAPVDEETLALFQEKSNFLLQQSKFNPFTFSEIYLRDFIGYVFERKDVEGTEVEPFEEEMSYEYKDIWLPQYDKKVNEYDYSGYGIWRYNPIVLYRTKNDGKLVNKHHIILKDYASNDKFDFIENRYFSIISPITYVGRNRYAKNARYLYAFAIDLDGVGMKEMRDILHQQRKDLLDRNGRPETPHAPMANIIVNSGHGLHMYYLLDHPVALYKDNVPLLRKMKEGLTNIVWNSFTSSLEDRQYQGIYQGFRMPGTLTKFGEKIRAFRNEDAPMHSIFSLNGFLSTSKLTDKEIAQLEGKSPYNPSGITIDEAKRLYPEWHERVIVMGDKRPKKWHIKRDLYDWWLKRLRNDEEQIVPGHRYFCLLTLAIYAMKCDIDREELVEDACSLLGRMDRLTTDEDNHFTMQDIEDALMGYKLWYCTFPRNSIKYLTGLEFKENKRNKRKQKIHLKLARSNRDILCIDRGKENWWDGGGRPKGAVSTADKSRYAKMIYEWRYKHKDSNNKSACAKELNLSRPTVRKWWNKADPNKPIRDGIKEGMKAVNPDNPLYRKALSAEEYLEIMIADDITTIGIKKR